MLDASPPEVEVLAALLFVMVFAKATGDIATDAWAAASMSDSRASVCQTIGLSLGMEGSTTLFFLLSGRGFLDLPTLLRGLAAAALLVLGLFALRAIRAPKKTSEHGA